MQVHSPLLLLLLFGVLLVVVLLRIVIQRKRKGIEERKQLQHIPNTHLPFCSDELGLIVSFLGKEDIGNLSLVCKEAKQAAYSSLVWNEVCGCISVGRLGGLLNSERYDGKIRNLKLMVDYDENSSFEEDDFICQLFERLNDKFPMLNYISIRVSIVELYKFNILSYLECLENLTHLKLLDNSKECTLYNNSLMPVALPKKLEYIKVKGFNRVVNRCSVFESIFTQPTRIKTVKFEKNQGYNEMKFQTMDTDLEHLTCISLSGTTNISTESFNSLMYKCPNLKQLNLSNSTFSKDINVNIPCTIEKLDISSCVLDTTTLTAIACLPCLRYVNLLSTLIPLDILIIYCKVGRIIICQIANKEEIQILKSLKHIQFKPISPLHLDSNIKEIKHSTSFDNETCKLYYLKIFKDTTEAPKLTLRPTKLHKMKLVQYKE